MSLRSFAVLALGLSALGTTLAAQVTLQPTGRTLTLGNVSYFVPPTPVSTLPNAPALVKPATGELIPFSVIPTSKTTFDEEALQETIAIWSVKDDVWSEAFLTGTVLFLSVPLSSG